MNGPRAGGRSLHYNGHGDLAAETTTSGSRTNAYTYGPFGAPNDTTPTNTTTHRWTAAWNKNLDTTSNLSLMGARPYDPTLGRFLATDPIEGGSHNNYDYAGQDPINDYDLDGTLCVFCKNPFGVVSGAKGVYNGGKAVVHTVAKYAPTSQADVARIYSIGETAAVTAVFAGLTIANVAVVCPAAIAAGGPVGAAGCVFSTAASATATVVAGVATVKETKAYIQDKQQAAKPKVKKKVKFG